MIIRCLYDKLVPIAELKPHPQNPNRHSTEQVERLAKILNYQGWRYPIKVSKRSGFITSGHGRLEAARVNSWPEVPVNFQDYESFDQEFADIVSDNSVASWAELDLSSIQNDLKDLPNLDIDLLGIKDFSLAALMTPPEIPDDDDEMQSDSESVDDPEIDPDVADEIPDHIEPRVKPGEQYKIGEHRVINGDCLAVLKTLPDNSVDSLVTDPPAGISFMGKAWDDDKGGRKEWIGWLRDVMKECLRVMKPGAHGLVWAIPRTSHWTATALEDAGFEIRDQILHCFGSGFPKSLAIDKAIDKALGAERDIVGKQSLPGSQLLEMSNVNKPGHNWTGIQYGDAVTDDAKKWVGYGTALKPAVEMWCLIRKPCSEGTVAANVLLHGTGGINIDVSRISANWETDPNIRGWQGGNSKTTGVTGNFGCVGDRVAVPNPQGRFPANLIFSHSPGCVEVGVKKVGSGNQSRNSDVNRTVINTEIGSGKGIIEGRLNDSDSICNYGTETVAAWDCVPECAVFMLDQQSGNNKSTVRISEDKDEQASTWSLGRTGVTPRGHEDSGGASRFFKTFQPCRFQYVPKPSKSEKNLGCEGLEDKKWAQSGGAQNALKRGDDEYHTETQSGYDTIKTSKNHHPTVKSTRLMKYLICMITPDGGTLLDCFGGSGTTLVAAHMNHFSAILIEQSPEYCDIILARIEHIAEKSAVKIHG